MNEIRRLCRITPPDVAVELNVLPVHVEHLGSIENVANAKAEARRGNEARRNAVLECGRSSRDRDARLVNGRRSRLELKMRPM